MPSNHVSCIVGFLAFLCHSSATLGQANPARASSIVPFEVQETGGIRRRNDLVSTRFVLEEPVSAQTHFAVLREGTAVPSQIQVSRGSHDRILAIDLDFLANLGPYETQTYELQYGPLVESSEVPPSGFQLTEGDEVYLISNRDLIEWTVRKDLKSLFRFLLKPNVNYVEADSGGFVFEDSAGQLHRLSDRRPTAVRVLRSGPIACELEFEYTNWPVGSRSQVRLEFVRSKSWVRALWTLKGGNGVRGMGAEMHLALEGREKLIDFGAGDFVYTKLRANQATVLEAARQDGNSEEPAWTVRQGERGSLSTLAVAPRGHPDDGLGGWMHVMDESRCTALAVDDFGRETRDRIEVDDDGRLRIFRDFGSRSSDQGERRFQFWVHFVTMPVHVGAGTSPQAMRRPLEVRWKQGKH